MKHLKRDATRFDVYDMGQAVAREQGLSLDGEDLEQVVQYIKQSLLKEVENPAMFYGRHSEAMFGYVAAALKEVVIVKKEDTGETISRDTNLITPDYRLRLPQDNEFFVEVKNVYQEDPNYRLSFTDDYLNSLESYAGVFALSLKFAIYWSRWNKWTLISADKLIALNGRRSISMIEAAKMNEMAMLGDMTIGTKVPLTLRLVAKPSTLTTINADGKVDFTVEKTEVYCAGKLVLGSESNLAWYMMLHGDWSELKQVPLIEDEHLIAVDIIISPETWEPEQGFAFIGELSGMISRQYKYHTAPAGQPKLIRPLAEPDKFGIAIANDHKSESLPLWRFVLKPNYD